MPSVAGRTGRIYEGRSLGFRFRTGFVKNGKHKTGYAQYGRLAPASKADFAFVQHMLHQLDDNGTMACILPHGVLFRGAAEGHIREYIVKERNWLDAVIGLPANIFYGTSIPTCILVFKKCREHPEDILFMDASPCFEKAKNQNYLRPEDIDKIVGMWPPILIFIAIK